MYQDRVNTPVIAGLPQTMNNPIFTKDTFKMFIPSFGDFIDVNEGKYESAVASRTSDIDISVDTELTFENAITENPEGYAIKLNTDKNFNLIKNTKICYKEAYQVKTSNGSINYSGIDSPIISIDYYLDEELVHSESITLENGINLFEYNFILSTTDYNQIMTVNVNTNVLLTLNSVTVTVDSNFKPATGDGKFLYEAFCGTADNKILETIWNSDWKYAMSLCIAHYLSIVNTETQRSFGLGNLAKDNDPKGLIINEKENKDQIKYDYKNVTLSRNAAKFWQTTEFGRLLIILLDTKSVLTMIVAN